jgi:predicted site-specific integrase-resolvase
LTVRKWIKAGKIAALRVGNEARIPRSEITQRRGQETLVLSDIGSGLKASRRQLQRLLKLVCADKVAEVAITSEDRLTGFGQEYLRNFCRAHTP